MPLVQRLAPVVFDLSRVHRSESTSTCGEHKSRARDGWTKEVGSQAASGKKLAYGAV